MTADNHALSKSIAIIGIGARFPDAPDADAFWHNIEAGRTAFSDIPKERWNHDIFFSKNQRDTDKAWVSKGSFIEGYQDFAPLHYGIAPRRLEVMDPQQRLLIETTRVAIQDAGYETEAFPRHRTGVYVGLSIAEFQQLTNARMFAMRIAAGDFGGVPGSEALRQALIDLTSNVVPVRAFTLSGSLTALASASIAQTFDLGGPAYTMDSACASASIAVHDAVSQLRTGAIDAAVAGGAYLNLAPDNLVAFTKIGAISPTGACRPFDHRSDGFVQSDGVAMLFLKRLDDALSAGDRIYAVIRGSGCNNDGRGEGPMTPRKQGQLAVLKATYEDAKVCPNTVSYFEAHGTATSIGDPVEIAALGETLLEAKVERPVPVGSVKGNIGHAMSAAGIAGLVKAIKVLQRRVVPPQPGFERAHPKLGLERYPLTVPTEATELRRVGEHPLRVAVSSFGFGGTNSHILLEEPPTVVRPQRVSRPISVELEDGAKAQDNVQPEAVLVTAPTPALLAAHMKALAEAITSGPAHEASLADLAYTLNARRRHERYRAVVAARSSSELVQGLLQSSQQLAETDDTTQYPLRIGRNITVHDSQGADPKVAFLFPGQGAQKVGLLRDVKARFSTFAAAFERYAHAADRSLPRPLASYLYPQVNTEVDLGLAEEALKGTEVCQPAMAALGLAMAELLKQLGVQPVVSAGHSLGEFNALACAGVLTPEDAVRLVTVRGAAMRALPLEDTGTMAAIMADEATVRAHLEGLPEVWIANINQPQQVSISGTTQGVARAGERLMGLGIDVRPLSVSHAFHSPLVEGVSEAVAKMLGSMQLGAPQHTVASCIDDAPHSADAERTRQVLLRHATSPVRFTGALKQAQEAGANIFVQVGAGNILTNFAKATLGKDQITCVNLADNEPDGGYSTIEGLCTLAAVGVPVKLMLAYAGEARQVVTLPETPLERQAYWPLKNVPQPTAELTLPLADPEPWQHLVQLSGQDAAVQAPGGNGPLVELFTRQNQILTQTAEIIATQNRLLLGGAAPTEQAKDQVLDLEAKLSKLMAEPTAPAVPVGQPAQAVLPESSAVAAQPAASQDTQQITERVFEIVAKVSAFPKKGLRGEQRLIDELGFDSLMVADLSAALQGAYPNLGQLPPSLFDLKTTLKDLETHVRDTVTGKTAAVQPTFEAPTGPVSRYRVVPAARARGEYRPLSLAGQTWLVTEDGTELTIQVSAQLAARGAELVRVQFTAGGVASAATLSRGTLNLWPEAFVEGLPAAIAQMGIKLTGVVHGASLALSDSADFVNPIDLLHPLASLLSTDFFVTLTGLGGHMGLDKSPSLSMNLLQGSLSGYSKALARERSQAQVRCLDVDPRAPAERTATWIVEEIISGDLSPEVGFDGQRWLPELVEVAAAPEPTRKLGGQDVVLVTGGTGEIGALAATWAAQQGAKAIVLVGRRTADATVEGQLKRLQGLGVQAHYVTADITDKEGLRAALRPVLETVGAVTVVFHAAGVIEDAPASKKSLQSVHRVMNVKVLGLQNVLRSLPGLKDVVLFSSWAGRFGNAGQTDYSAANDLLDRIAVAGLGATRVVSIVFPPWSSTKMVSTIPESIKKIMMSEGVTFLDDAEGLASLEAIFNEGIHGIEIIGRRLPSRTVHARHTELLSLAEHPYLDDHRLQGRAVLPLASATDLAAWAFRESNGRVGPLHIENLELVRGLAESDVAEIQVTGRRSMDGVTRAGIELTSRGEQANPGLLAYRAKASNAPAELEAPPALGGPKQEPKVSLETFYADQTFHGPQLAGIESILSMTSQGIEGTVRTASIASWMPQSARTQWTVDPLVVDASFQLAGYWLFQNRGQAGFPVGFERLDLLRPFGAGKVRCRVLLKDIDDEGFGGDIHYFDEQARYFGRLVGIRGRFAKLASHAEAEPAPAGMDSVPDEAWQVGKFPEIEELDQRFQMAELVGLKNPYFNLHTGTARDTSEIDGVRMLNYSSYNYLGLSGHPEVVKAAQDAIAKYGTSVSASRVASGERPVHRELEAGLAQHVGVQDALVFVSGHATNVTTVGHMLDREDLVLHDSLIHDSILQGIYLSGATRRPFPHNDLDALEKTISQIRTGYRRVLICAEGIYSMDGDMCDLPRLIEIKKRYKALLMIDEAHSSGVLGPAGRGVGHHFEGVDPNDVDIWMGTLSKSFASCGGFIAGSKDLIRYLKYTAPGFVYSAGIPPPNAAAALKALELMHTQPELVEQCRSRSLFFRDAAKARGIDTGDAVGAAVVPAIVGNSLECMRLSENLAKRNINVQPIVYPAVEDEKARLRFFISALHSEAQLTHTVDVLVEELAKVREQTAKGGMGFGM